MTQLDNIMLKHIHLLLLFLLCHESNSQSSDKVFHSIGTSIDIGSSPINLTSSNDPHQLIYIAGLLSIDYGFRYNITEFSDEMVLSASISPGISLAGITGNETTGLWSLSLYNTTGALLKIPLIINIEKGVGASFMSKAEFGGLLGLGVEYNYIFDQNAIGSINPYYTYNWMQLCLKMGLRFFMNDRINCISLKLGYGSNKHQDQIETKPLTSMLSSIFAPDSNNQPFSNSEFYKRRTLTLTYSRIINY